MLNILPTHKCRNFFSLPIMLVSAPYVLGTVLLEIQNTVLSFQKLTIYCRRQTIKQTIQYTQSHHRGNTKHLTFTEKIFNLSLGDHKDC